MQVRGVSGDLAYRTAGYHQALEGGQPDRGKQPGVYRRQDGGWRGGVVYAPDMPETSTPAPAG